MSLVQRQLTRFFTLEIEGSIFHFYSWLKNKIKMRKKNGGSTICWQKYKTKLSWQWKCEKNEENRYDEMKLIPKYGFFWKSNIFFLID